MKADLGAWGVGSAAAATYAVAAAPGGAWYDTQEIATAAYRLGVSHPPGQALHAIVGKAATLVPLGSVVFRTNLLSAVGAGLAVALLFVVARGLARTIGATAARATAAGIAAAIAVGLGDALVGQATRTEVYAPAFALFLAGLVDVVGWCEGPRDPRRLVRAALFAGLAATLHPPAGLSLVLVAAWLAVLFDPRAAIRLRAIGLCAAAVVLGLLPLVLLFGRCRGALEPCWSVGMSARDFLGYVAGRGYAHNLQGGAGFFRALSDALAFLLARTGYVPAVVLAAAALVATLRSATPRRWGAAYLGAFLLPIPFLAVMAFEEENPDVHGYLLPAFGLLVAAAGAAVSSVRMPRVAFAAAVLVLVLAPPVLATRIGRVVRTHYVLPDAFQEASMSEPPPRALLLTSSDQMLFGAWYAQLVEGDRPDLVVLGAGVCGSRWHWEALRRKRRWLDPRVARPVAFGSSLQDQMAAAALELANGRAFRIAESPHWKAGAASLGVVFDLDAREDASDRAMPRTLAGEAERHRARYLDGGDRVYRILRQRRAAGMLLRGRPRAAASELLRALWEASLDERRAYAGLPERGDTVRPEPGMHHLAKRWISDEPAVRAQLASLAFQMGRTDLAAQTLLPSLRGGDDFAALLQADMLARDGRYEDAERLYRTVAPALPDRRAMIEMGLALLDSYRARHASAKRHAARARRSSGAEEISETLEDVERYVERRARENAPPVR